MYVVPARRAGGIETLLPVPIPIPVNTMEPIFIGVIVVIVVLVFILPLPLIIGKFFKMPGTVCGCTVIFIIIVITVISKILCGNLCMDVGVSIYADASVCRD